MADARARVPDLHVVAADAAGDTRALEALAEAGMMAMMFANAPAAMAPWGGNRAVFGTDPVAFACPLQGRAPIVVDLSLSKVARGNIVTAKQRGEKIPEGWALDEHGKPTTDPDAALRGTMQPMGDAKGTALALMVELLAGALIGQIEAVFVDQHLLLFKPLLPRFL